MISRSRQFRLNAATWMLPVVFGLPVIFTIRLSSGDVNQMTAALMLAFSLPLLPEAFSEIATLRKLRAFRVGGLILVACIFSWHFHQGTWGWNWQGQLYASSALFGAALVAWFKHYGEDGLKFLAITKVAIVSAIAIAISWTLLFAGNDWLLLSKNMPVYRHVRHLNYDLMLAISMASTLWISTKSRIAMTGILLSTTILCFLSVGSAGRGGLLATVVFAGACAYAHLKRPFQSSMLPLFASGAVGVIAVFFTDQASFLTARTGKFLLTGENLTSSRLAIWGRALTSLGESPASLLFGYGPNAFFELQPVSRIWGNIVQPHNALVQWLLEYGLIGGMFAAAVWVSIIRRSWSRIRNRGSSDAARTISATLIGCFFFSLSDGILYHAIPLMMVIAIVAFLFVDDKRLSSPPTASTQQV